MGLLGMPAGGPSKGHSCRYGRAQQGQVPPTSRNDARRLELVWPAATGAGGIGKVIANSPRSGPELGLAGPHSHCNCAATVLYYYHLQYCTDLRFLSLLPFPSSILSLLHVFSQPSLFFPFLCPILLGLLLQHFPLSVFFLGSFLTPKIQLARVGLCSLRSR